MSSQTVEVVGASAAGLLAAYRLAEAGRSVRVHERADSLRPRPRTLIVTHRFRPLLGPPAEEAIVHEIRRFELFANGRRAVVPLRRPDLVIERSRLVAALAKRAVEAGVLIEYGSRLVSLSGTRHGAELRFARSGGAGEGGAGRVQAPVVIGADGAFGPVARAMARPAPAPAPLVQATVALPPDLPPDTTRVWFVPQDTPYFYWLIPESPDRGVLGLIAEDGAPVRRLLDRFLEARGLTPLDYQGGRIPIYTGWVPPHRRLGGGQVYLAGDAASQVKVTTVGGIVTGLRGALGVVERLLTGRRSRLRALRLEMDAHLLVRRALHRFGEAEYCRLLDLLDGAALGALARYSRDETPRLLWELARRQPRLLGFGLRSWFRSRGVDLAAPVPATDRNRA